MARAVALVTAGSLLVAGAGISYPITVGYGRVQGMIGVAGLVAIGVGLYQSRRAGSAALMLAGLVVLTEGAGAWLTGLLLPALARQRSPSTVIVAMSWLGLVSVATLAWGIALAVRQVRAGRMTSREVGGWLVGVAALGSLFAFAQSAWPSQVCEDISFDQGLCTITAWLPVPPAFLAGVSVVAVGVGAYLRWSYTRAEASRGPLASSRGLLTGLTVLAVVAVAILFALDFRAPTTAYYPKDYSCPSPAIGPPGGCLLPASEAP